MTNKEFLLNIGFDLEEDDYYNNERVNDFFNVYNLVPFNVTFINQYGEEETKEVSPSNCEFAFQDKIWSRLNLSQRLQVLKWEQTNFLRANGKNGIPPFEYLGHSELNNIVYNAASTNHAVVLNLKNLSIGNGYEALKTIIHESIHHLDFFNFNSLLSKYQVYIPLYLSSKNALNNIIMELPTSGLIYNFRTGRNNLVTRSMARDILLLKNQITRVNKRKSPGQKVGLNEKLGEAFYCNSPLELRAFVGSSEYLDRVMGKNQKEYGIDPADMLLLGQKDKTLSIIKSGQKLIKKVYGTDLNTAMDMKLVFEFNRYRYGKNTNAFINKKLMKKREENIKKFQQKFEGKEK